MPFKLSDSTLITTKENTLQLVGLGYENILQLDEKLSEWKKIELPNNKHLRERQLHTAFSVNQTEKMIICGKKSIEFHFKDISKNADEFKEKNIWMNFNT